MKALPVEFAPARRLPGWIWTLATVAALAVAGWQSWSAWQTWLQVLVLRQEAAQRAVQLDAQRRAAVQMQEKAAVKPPYFDEAARIARIAAFPLQGVLGSVEHAQVEGVRVVSIDVDAEHGTARVDLEMNDRSRLAPYLEALDAGEPTPKWHLAEWRAGSGDGPSTATVLWSDNGLVRGR